MSSTHALAPHLPYLRRYARALTGTQASGDSYVRATLTTLSSGEQVLDESHAPRVALYRLFHQIWSTTATRFDDPLIESASPTPEERLQELSSIRRAALLLTTVESFNLAETSAILDEAPEILEREIADAQHTIERELSSTVLIIEDEPVIALDLENLVMELGHEVVGTAATHDQAVRLAFAKKPGLVLADVNLGDGGSGLDAVTEILAAFDVPVIFITAYPEKLLTGEKPEPTYLIAKPFQPETVQATIGQALFFHPIKRQAA